MYARYARKYTYMNKYTYLEKFTNLEKYTYLIVMGRLEKLVFRVVTHIGLLGHPVEAENE